MKNFLGKDGFNWWVGVVENRKDPLNLGRCQIRIFGWHTENKQQLPTAELPWSLPVLPSNNSKTFTTPVEGDWTIGFFFDGESAQFPCYLGVLPGIAGAKTNPQQGFSDPRTDDELRTSPNLPKSNTLEDDGSGTTTVNQPAVRNPSNIGFPSLNPLVINDLNNPPAQISQRTAELTTGIAGPNAQTLGTSIAGYAQGAASALQPGLSSTLTSLVPSASSLAAGLVPPDLQSQIPSTSSLTSSISSIITDAKSIATNGFSSATQATTAAQAQVSAQLATASEAASKAASDAASSSSASLGDLKSKSSNIAADIASKLSSLAPANITTKTPVNLNGVIPNANLGAVTSGDKVNALAPNPIPTQVPLEKTASTQQKSLENSIKLYKESILSAYGSIQTIFSNATTIEELNSKSSQAQQSWDKIRATTSNIADIYKDPTIKTDLDAWTQTYRDNLNSSYQSAKSKLGA